MNFQRTIQNTVMYQLSINSSTFFIVSMSLKSITTNLNLSIIGMSFMY